MIEKAKSLYQTKIIRLLNSENKISIFVLIFWAFASRGLGLVREAMVGRLQSLEADIFGVASTLNEAIVAFLIIGSLGIALLPQIIKLEQKNTKDDLNSYLTWVLFLYSLLISSICFLGIIFSEWFLKNYNTDLWIRASEAGKSGEYVLLNQIFLAAPVIFAVKSVLGIFLNAKKSFTIYSLDGVLSNVGSILGLTLLYAWFGLTGAGVGLSIGFLIVAISFAWDSFRLGYRPNLTGFPELPAYLFQSLLLFLPRILIFPAARTAELLIGSLARDSGEVAALRMANNVQGVFYGLMVAVGTVFLPDITNILVEKGKSTQFWNHLWKYLKSTAQVSLIASVLTIVGAPVILLILRLFAFGSRNAFINNDQIFWSIIALIAVGSLSIIFQSVGEILSRYYIALEKTKVPLLTSFVANIMAVIVAILLAQVTGAAMAVMVGFVVNNLVMTAILGFECWRDYKSGEG